MIQLGLGGLGHGDALLGPTARLSRLQCEAFEVRLPKVLSANRVTIGLVEELLVVSAAGRRCAFGGVLSVGP